MDNHNDSKNNKQNMQSTTRKLPYIKNDSSFTFDKYKNNEEKEAFVSLSDENIKTYLSWENEINESK